MANCIICGSATTALNDEKMKVTYDVCHSCDFISKQKGFLLTADVEKSRYDTHQYSEEDHYYNNTFLNLIKEYIEPYKVKTVLDYGSGPFRVLTKFLKEQQYNVYDYDPYYHPDDSYQKEMFDLIVSTEVIEHFYDPIKEFDHLLSILKDKGYLLLMTNFRTMPHDEFINWWYKRDNTHVAFYNLNVFTYLEEKYNLKRLKTNEKNIILLQKR